MNRREAIKTSAAFAAALPFLNAATWKPALFTPAQNETVVALVDLIIPATDTPGAKAALVNRYMDLIFSAGPKSEADGFLNGLKLLDKDQPFVKLPAAKQIALLESLDNGEGEGHEFFRMAKSMTSRLYYQTEAGFKELNKHGIPKTYYACTS
jgi:hypothetical protein